VKKARKGGNYYSDNFRIVRISGIHHVLFKQFRESRTLTIVGNYGFICRLYWGVLYILNFIFWACCLKIMISRRRWKDLHSFNQSLTYPL